MQTNFKKVLIIITYFYLLTSPSAFALKSLNVCSELSFAPLSMKTQDGKPSGFEIDILKEYVKARGYVLDFHEVKWTDSIPALLLKKCDLIASGMSPTLARLKMVDFSVPYYVIIDQLVLNKDNQNVKNFSNFHDFNEPGIKISVRQGNEVDFYLREHLKKAEILGFPNSDDDVVNALISGKVDAAALHSPTAALIVSKHKDKLFIFPSPIPTGSFMVSYVFRKSDKSLREDVDEFLMGFKKTAEFDKLYRKYF